MTQEKENKNIISGLVLGLIVLAAVSVFFWRGGALSKKPDLDEKNLASPQELEIPAKFFDFGRISMAKGNVSYKFQLKNIGDNKVLINKIYTSCMCTSVLLKTSAGEWGPFGMPGHGYVPNLNILINPNETAEAEAIFDPAAHGPAGLGKFERFVYLEGASGSAQELKIFGEVAP